MNRLGRLQAEASVCLAVAALLALSLVSGCAHAPPQPKEDYAGWRTGEDAPFLHARLLMRDGRYAEAVDVIDRWPREFDSLEGELMLAESLFKSDDFARAAGAYRELLCDPRFWRGSEWDLDWPGTPVGKPGAAAEQGELTDGIRQGHVLYAAVSFLGNGELAAARGVCEGLVLNGFEREPGLLMVRGEIEYQRGRYDLAKADFSIALELADEEHARMRLAQIREQRYLDWKEFGK